MPLLAIACPRCQHTGYAGADRVPGMLHCSRCGFARMVRDGVREIRSPNAAALNAADHQPKRPRGARKRRLVPRETAA
jgi:hypothetical protein